MDKEVEAVMEKLKNSLQTSGLTGRINYNSVALVERNKEIVRYCANFSVSVKLPDGYTQRNAAFFGEPV
jgi:hypothetical protein